MTEELMYHSTSELSISRPPEEVLKEAHRAATALKDVVRQTKSMIKIGKSEHLKCEAWQTLGHFYGLVGSIKATRFVQFGDVAGFEAVAELRNSRGELVSTAEAMCLNDEERWRSRTKYEWRGDEQVKVGEEAVPLFQLRSMAQTRAISRVHANALRWVVVLAGYNPTPAEEVDNTNGVPVESAIAQPQRKSQAADVISEAQGKRLYAIGSQVHMTKEDMKTLIGRWGYSHSKDIKRADYEAIVSAFERFGQPTYAAGADPDPGV